MPLFKSHQEPEPVAAPPARKGSVFRGRRSSDEESSVRSGSTTGSFFARNNNFNVHKDPTIIAARQKVTFAEKAEAEADRALASARNMVREARDHVRFLEKEAAEEQKRARAKQSVANDVSKSARGLGRHGN
ncbi:hypothetical protein B0H16DRAFT_928828 [Mycena metata]|uniref:Uncharacterized protein n=1 Tax=Mycena metata TaxID=1033252 RepID=A0AAD7IPB7_9AGAR|nr:hypothetical protein B0H16DRAFT_928828 [Mycena metata]